VRRGSGGGYGRWRSTGVGGEDGPYIAKLEQTAFCCHKISL